MDCSAHTVWAAYIRSREDNERMNRIKELINFYSRPLSGKQCDYLLLVDADTALETAEYLKKLYKPYESRKKLPCTCGRKPTAQILTRKPIIADEEELELNPRARSAKLRAIRKI